MNEEENHENPIPVGNFEEDISVYIKKAVAGDQKAFKHIYELHSGKMYSLCKRYGGSNEDADDLFQEGYMKVFSSLKAYKGLGSFEGWVRRIFVNTCLDYLKAKPNFQIISEVEIPPDQHPTITGEQELKLTNDELLKTIQDLPSGYRLIINLFLIEGYSHKEIGDMLQITEGTSKSQLYKAKTKLQEVILKKIGG
jgi:RNA polymerase sigma factor (sigma-70 family)